MINGVTNYVNCVTTINREPWSSGYERRLTFQRSWVWIPSMVYCIDITFCTLICCKNCIVFLKSPKINKKEAGVGPFLNNKSVFSVSSDQHLFLIQFETLLSFRILIENGGNIFKYFNTCRSLLIYFLLFSLPTYYRDTLPLPCRYHQLAF